jgi:hypothetical protein
MRRGARYFAKSFAARALRALAIAAIAVLAIAGAPAVAQERQEQVAANDLRWFAGEWSVRYQDKALGAVVGTARNIGSRVEVDLLHPKTGATYRLQSYRIHFEGTQLELEFEGNSPPSGLEIAAPPPSVPGAMPLPIPVGSQVVATVGQGRETAPALADDVPPYLGRLKLVFEVPAEGAIEELTGTWSYETRDPRDIRHSRAGAYDSGNPHRRRAGELGAPGAAGDPGSGVRRPADQPADPARGAG